MRKGLTELLTKYKAYILPIVVGISSLILILFVIYPQLTGFFRGQKDLQTAEQKLKKLQVKAADLENLDEGDLNKNLDYALTALPADKDYPTIIGVFQRISAESNMSLESLQVGSSGQEQGKKVPVYVVKVELLGTKQGFEEVLRQIEKNPQVMRVNGIDLATLRSDVDISLSVDIFYLPTPTRIGSVDADLPVLNEEEQSLLARLASIIPAPVSATEAPPLLPRGKANPFE